MRTFVVLSMCLGLLGGGCSDDGDEEAKAGKTNEENAKQNSKQQAGAIYNAMGGEGASAADQLYAAGNSSQGTVTAQSFKGVIVPASLHPLADPAGCECTGNSCTFTSCDRGGLKLNGTLSAEGGNFKCDLTWETDGTNAGIGSVTKVHVKADMTVTDTSIKGTLHTDGSIELKGVSLPDISLPGGGNAADAGNVSWENDATWDVVTANKQPTGGKVDWSGTYKSGKQPYTGKGTTTFP